jgi:putative flippase GtrA
VISRLLADQRVRFLLVGGVNTVVGYGLFALFQFSFGHTIGYLGSLIAAYAIATFIAFTLHRRITFQVRGGRVLVEFLRYAGITVISLLLNAAILALLIELAHWNPYVAQAVSLVTTTIVSYVGHKWFTFRRPAALSPPPPPKI